MTLTLSYQYRHKNDVAYLYFEQLSIIPMVSLLLTFIKYTASGVLTFSILKMHLHHFYVSKYNQWEWTQIYIRTFAKKQKNKKMSTGKKAIEEKQTILLESMQPLM